MTDGEKIIWAAAYAAEYCRMLHDLHRTRKIEDEVKFCVENAWAAVVELREAKKDVFETFGSEGPWQFMEEALK